jgi:hypothetical protein
MGVGADLAVGAEQGDGECSGLSHEEAIGWIGMERLRQARSSNGNGWIQGH